MATFSTYAEVLRPDHVMMKMYRAGVEKQHPGIVLADLLSQTGGAYETTMFSRFDVSPAETPRWRRIPPGGIPASPRSDVDRVLRRCRGARIEEHALPDGRHWHHIGPAAE